MPAHDEPGEAALAPGTGPTIGVVAALGDPLFCEAVRMRLQSEPDVAILAITQRLGAAIEAAGDERADVLVLGSALLTGLSDEALAQLRHLSGTIKLVLVSAPSDTSGRALASTMRGVEVVSQLESPDRLLAAIRALAG